jgi:hypothetical protein
MGLPPPGGRWLRAAGGYGRQVATISHAVDRERLEE